MSYGSADGRDGPHTPDAPYITISAERQHRPSSSLRRVLGPIAVVSACAAVAYSTQFHRGHGLALNEDGIDSSAEGTKNVDGGTTAFLSLFKRTFASLEPQRDGAWLSVRTSLKFKYRNPAIRMASIERLPRYDY